MNKFTTAFACIFAAAVSLQAVDILHAEDAQRAPAVPSQINAGFSPSYTVTPIVQKLKARRGQTVSFSFEVTSELEDVIALVAPIALRQNKNGVIVPDLDNPPPRNLRLKDRKQVRLIKDKPITIEGTINVPANQSPFHSFGILIRDEGREAARKKQGNSKFGINFITQYILRCDIEVANGRNDDIRKLVVSKAEFVDFNGLPLAKVTVQNPTQSTVEFEIDSRVLNNTMSESRSYIKLASPVRQSLGEPDRWLTRVMPDTTLEMFAPWPKAIFAGAYQMETRVTSKRRVFKTSVTELEVGEDQFPGQAAWVEQVAPNVHAQPSQIALGQRAPYKRMKKINLVNHSEEPIILKLEMTDVDGQPLPWAIVRPAEITIQPELKRLAVVALTRIEDRSAHKIGFVSVVTTTPAGEILGQEKLPAAFFGSNPLIPELEAEPTTVQVSLPEKGAMLILPVTNRGTFPMPLRAIAKFTDGSNNPIDLHAGYGKWLLPGQTERLEFPLTGSKIETGSMRGEVGLYDEADNVLHTQDVQLATPSPDQSAAK